ncbi:TPA: hypothetical protein ACPJDI_002026, partial [Haemophilus influenzae]
NAETYNRQLHIDEIKWIKENAKRFAQEESERLGHQVTEQEAMERLITQAAQEVDYAWFKKIGETDGQAQSFLRSATAQGDVPPYDNRGTFINSDGKRQSMFTVVDKDEYYSTGKYSNALAQFDKANGHVVTKTLQPKVKYNLYTKSLSDGADAALKGTLHAFDHPEDVLKPISFGIANCLKEDMCISAGKEMLSDSGKAVWQSGKDIFGAGYHLDDVNYLYGKNMVNEIDAIAAVRGGTALLELMGTGKAIGSGINLIAPATKKILTNSLIHADDITSRLRDLYNREVTIYRVEGTPNQRLIINDTGDVFITGDTTLYLNFGSKKRAIGYLQQKIDQNLTNAEIKSFVIPREYRKQIQDLAVAEKDIRVKDPDRVRPVIADPTKAKHQYGLRASQIEELKYKIKQGSGKNGN